MRKLKSLSASATVFATVLLGDLDPAWAAASAPVTTAMAYEVERGNPFGGILRLGVWGIPITVAWIVAIVNILNLSDGLDGLAAGITAIAAMTMLVSALLTGQPEAAVLLAAALLG
ncbi:MAG: hypothetical protein K6T83_24230, partial [Alicyclobacillus sp.]|nr:hypothetical protein [Alicyclobacillus sp.]